MRAIGVAVLLTASLTAAVSGSPAPAAAPASAGVPSALWGRAGEAWTPAGRLPDFSWAGYHAGEKPLPTLPPGTSVKQFGAKGDGTTDDTQAFLDALAQVKSGAIEIPPGRYRLTKILEMTRPGLVLRGAGPDKTVLFFPTPLEEIKPIRSQTTSGQPTSGYSWSGGFIVMRGSYGSRPLATVVGEAKRGDQAVRVSSAAGLKAGQRVEITVSDTPENTLAAHLYCDDPGPMDKLLGRSGASLVTRVTAVEGDRIRFDRPLRFDIRPDWKGQVRDFQPTVTECGLEAVTFEFPVTDYKGHFTEVGFNPVAMTRVTDCWVRNIRLLNADSGPMVSGCFNTVEGVVHESARKSDGRGFVGHHGIYLSGDDNLYTGFDVRGRYVHDVTVSHCAGNVIKGGRGADLCFDHHKRAPYENLFTDIDLGAGTRPWMCGGGAALGKNCGARGTFWNLRAARSLAYPPASFGPWSMNLVAVQTDKPSETKPDGKWFEAIPPAQIVPRDLHAAQLERRLGGGRAPAAKAPAAPKRPLLPFPLK